MLLVPLAPNGSMQAHCQSMRVHWVPSNEKTSADPTDQSVLSASESRPYVVGLSAPKSTGNNSPSVNVNTIVMLDTYNLSLNQQMSHKSSVMFSSSISSRSEEHT